MGEIPAETMLSDYSKEEIGLVQPHKVHHKTLGQEFRITMDHMEYNIDLPKDRFDLPAEVKALLAK